MTIKWYRVDDADKTSILAQMSVHLTPECGLRGDGFYGSICCHKVDPIDWTVGTMDDDAIESHQLHESVRFHNQVTPAVVDELLGVIAESLTACGELRTTYDPLRCLTGNHDYMTDTPAKVGAYKALIASAIALMELHDEFSTINECIVPST